jgi:hypothetical protein
MNLSQHEIKEYSDELVIESNRYRQKTWQERLKEAEAIEKILKEKAKEHLKLSRGRGKKGCQNSDKVFQSIDVKKEVAKVVGISHGTLHKLKVIKKERPELLNITPEERPVNSMYKQNYKNFLYTFNVICH